MWFIFKKKKKTVFFSLTQLCQSALPALTDFLQVAQAWDTVPLSGVFSTLFAVIVVEQSHLLQKVRATAKTRRSICLIAISRTSPGMIRDLSDYIREQFN